MVFVITWGFWGKRFLFFSKAVASKHSFVVIYTSLESFGSKKTIESKQDRRGPLMEERNPELSS